MNPPNLREAVEALGAMPDGYCFCSSDRVGDDSKVHEPECADLRAALNPDLSALGEATGTNPLNLMSDLSAVIFNHYIGQSASRIKASKLAEKVLVFITGHYEAEAARMATEGGSEPIAPGG